MNQINRREFLATAAGIAVPVALGLPAALPALVAAPKEEELPKRVFWNLEEFDKQVNFQLGEVALVFGLKPHTDTFLWHAARHHKIPSVLIDCREIMASDETKALIEVFRKVKVYHADRRLWPTRLYDIEPGTVVFVSNSLYGRSNESIRAIKKIAVERNLALVVGFPAYFSSNGYWRTHWSDESLSTMQSADLVLTVEKEGKVCDSNYDYDYLKVNVLKNRHSPNNQFFWYRYDEPYFINNFCSLMMEGPCLIHYEMLSNQDRLH